MTLDRLKYEVCYWLWCQWHMRLPRFKPFMVYVPKVVYGEINGRELAEPAYYQHWSSCRYQSRPWWHLCCNGDAGGWRTRLCDRLEHGWRNTRYYEGE